MGTQFSNQNPTDKSGKTNLPESVQNQPKFVKKCPKSVQKCPKVLQKYPVQGAEPLFKIIFYGNREWVKLQKCSH